MAERVNPAAGPRQEMVLVGGGHAHVQLLRRFAMAPLPGARLVLVVDRPVAVYSGMVPGFVAGQYARGELEIDVRPLAMRAGARYIGAAATGVDPEARRIFLEGRPPIPYDTASFDIGSTVAGLDLPGVRAHAFPTRPIGHFVRAVDDLLARARGRPSFRLAVVGGGAGGVELAFAFEARLRKEGVGTVAIHLIEAGPQILAGYPAAGVARVEASARRRGISIRARSRVAAVHADSLVLEGGEGLACDAVVWVVGAASLPLFRGSGLAVDAQGFVRVRPTLQTLDHDNLFAVGDCACFGEPPGLPKAGVFAVRQGPVLARNLRARAAGGRLETYRPQRDFLSLLNLGDGRAIGTKWGAGFEGAWVFRLKDWIDRRFMTRFQVLTDGGDVTPAFTRAPSMGALDMPCGGCAAKVGESVLARALERLGIRPDPAVVMGLEAPDDAAAIVTNRGEVVASTIDGFRAFTDDPYLVGRVAAVNAASDLWAKGVAPRFALAQVSVPDGDPGEAEEVLYQALAGARAAFDPEGIALLGGHTTSSAELAVGFAVHGLATSADALVRKGGLAPGDRLILTKPLGTGVLFHADMRGLARGEWMDAAIASMVRTNAAASRVMLESRASASTDVSGFGLAGHLGEMLRASKASAVIELAAVPLLPGARELLARGLRSTFHPENARARRALAVAPGAAARSELDILFDPQTSGGLLFAVPAERAAAAVDALRARGDRAADVIGEVRPPRPDAALFEVA
jgi:selenide,water dikinase